MTDAPYIVTIFAGPEAGAPSVQVRADDEQTLELRIQALLANGTFASMGRAAADIAAQYNVGRGLGGSTLNAPVNAVVPEPEEKKYPGVKRSPAPRIDRQEEPPAAEPTPASTGFFGGNQEAPPANPEAPILAGIGPAKLVKSKPGAPRPFTAWADPRPYDVTVNIMNKTSDPNDPGLAAGTKKFWLIIQR